MRNRISFHLGKDVVVDVVGKLEVGLQSSGNLKLNQVWSQSDKQKTFTLSQIMLTHGSDLNL